MTDNKLVIPLVVTLSRMTFQNKVHWNTSKPVIWQLCSWISHMIFHAGVKMDQWADLSQLNLDAHVWTNPLGSLILLRGKSCSRSTPFSQGGHLTKSELRCKTVRSSHLSRKGPDTNSSGQDGSHSRIWNTALQPQELLEHKSQIGLSVAGWTNYLWFLINWNPFCQVQYNYTQYAQTKKDSRIFLM